MQRDYARWARHFWLAADEQIYCPPAARAPNAVPQLAFYSRTVTPRRAVEIGLLALEELASRGVAFHANLFGSRLDIAEAPFAASDCGVLDPMDLAALYGRCDVGICFSTTNYSLIPQEMMACGLPCVDLEGYSSESVFGQDGPVELSAFSPSALADHIERLMDDETLWQRRSDAGRAFVEAHTWQAAALEVEQGLREALRLRERASSAAG